MFVNRTSEWKVIPIEFLERFRCTILSVTIYHGRRSYIRVKSYYLLNFPGASCSISRVSIYDPGELDIRVKSYSHLNFSWASVVQFWASPYIMSVDHTFESKVMVVCICRELMMFNFERLDISFASIIHSSQKLWPFEFVESFRVQFWGSRYMMHVNRTSDYKVTSICISRELPLLNFERLNISWPSIIHSSQKLWPFAFA